MAAHRAHDLYRRWLRDLWNGDPHAADELVSSAFVGHWPDRDVEGPAELAAVVGETKAIFDTLEFELEAGPITEGDMVSARWTGTGQPSEGRMEFFGNDILRIDGNRIVEHWASSPAQA